MLKLKQNLYDFFIRPIGISENEAVEEAIRQSLEKHATGRDQPEENQEELTDAELIAQVKSHCLKVVHVKRLFGKLWPPVCNLCNIHRRGCS